MDTRLGGLTREVLVADTAIIHQISLLREVFFSDTSQIRQIGLVREVFVGGLATLDASLVREALVADPPIVIQLSGFVRENLLADDGIFNQGGLVRESLLSDNANIFVSQIYRESLLSTDIVIQFGDIIREGLLADPPIVIDIAGVAREILLENSIIIGKNKYLFFEDFDEEIIQIKKSYFTYRLWLVDNVGRILVSKKRRILTSKINRILAQFRRRLW